jgi:TonB-dependent receptor
MMNKLSLRGAVRRVLLGLSVATAGSILHGVATAQDQEAAAPATLDEVEVVGRQRSAADDILLERIEAETVSDLVSSEQISRVGDSTVSLALRRLPGVTLVGDQFIYIRGLGERYSSTTVNGAYVPSPDLTRNVIPMDLFPAEIVDSISIQKGYSADQPAAFGGGNVDIRTRSIPDDFLFTIQIGSGTNSQSDDDGLTYQGGSDDDLGTDDGTRALPAEIRQAIQTYRGNLNQTNIFNNLLLDGEFHSFEEAQQINRELAVSLNRHVDFEPASMDPDLSAKMALGNSWYLGEAEQWKFGALALADYSNSWRNRERTVRSVTDPQNIFAEQLRTTSQVVATGSVNLGLEYLDEHKIEATGIFLRNTEDDVSLSLAFNSNFQQESGSRLRNYRIRYEERELELAQLHGSHRLGEESLGLSDLASRLDFAEGLTFDWYYSDATATTDIPSEILFSAFDTIDPDTTELIRTSIRSGESSADYRFTDLKDSATSYGTELSMPFNWGSNTIEVSGGYDYYEKGRSYIETRLRLGTQAAAAVPILVGTPGEVFTDEHILDPANQFALSLGGIGTESYLAGETVDSVWGKADFTFGEAWRVTAGARWEDFSRLAVPIDPYQFGLAPGIINVPDSQFADLVVTDDDYYPALAITYIRPDFWAENFQLRLGLSETIARPDLREIADAVYIDPLTEARIRGNPDLLHSELANIDLRAEWFFDSGDNLTVSLFYKDIESPIETVQQAGTDDDIVLSFINAESAEVYGIEFEGLKDLGFLSGGGWSDAFFVAGNVTVSDSEITIGQAAVDLTNNKRQMTQHSDLVVNFQLGYDSPGGMHSASLAYNMYSERIYFAGREGADDAVEQPFNSLDLIYSLYATEKLTLKLRLQNLLDEDIIIEQGGVDVLEQKHGSTARIDLSYRF